MALKKYQEKRDFSQTSEPEGAVMTNHKTGKTYVIQEHHARRLHWDLRLEMNGVLRSWAVPKEPPQNPGVRRLAVPVEDHPLEYAHFSGAIPEGQYGAGEVCIWDEGTYQPISISETKIVITINGTKLKGNYCLVKTKFRGKESWLFFKMKDNTTR